jgi:threonine dehydratase
MLNINDLLRAQQRLRPWLAPTRLVRSGALSERCQADIWLKLECQQPTGSFKVRGALHKLLTHPDASQPVVTASAGNHGLGVAYAASLLGRRGVTIFVPATAPAAKLAKLRRFRVNLQVTGQSYEDAHQAAEERAQATGALYLPAYDDLAVIAGQGSMALEVLTERPDLDLLLVPVGGGGLVAGALVASTTLAPAARVVGLQPTASPAALLSFREGRAIEVYEPEPTLADGLAGGFGRLPFALTHERLEVLLAEEATIRRAIYTLIAEEQLVVEASGAIAIAPLLTGELDVRGQTVVAVLTGANIDAAVLCGVLDEYAG